ncbi:hypothetical protein J4E83_001401 [Alternaria metachromatica]|uniref:uncharacterized protein n=1 Tax=Alternaria metachromatica TaxID=283354 RepID=UPI0020C276FF|nr:uncharacterized protein J4E83_001401 [Alternaria metachromatica]KAI4636446.1 hypothetical protein J4E83_001401 [Alternaria metachromatica]
MSQRRRYTSRTDEEIRKEMDPGHVPYRMGWPILAPLPMDTDIDARWMIPGSYQILHDVQDILIAHGLLRGTTAFHFAFRVPRDATEENDNIAHLTLFIRVDMLKHAHQDIEDAIIKIRASFRDDSWTEDVQIECIDYRARHSSGMMSFPVRHDEYDIHQQWKAISPDVMFLLSKHEWLSVEILRRGLIDDRKECSPTIVITTPTARDPKWFNIVVPSMMAEIAKRAPEFGIEILCGKTMLGAKRRNSLTDSVNDSSYAKIVDIGSSLGISGDETGCSTLGGSVTLAGGIRCGITSWHGVRDARLDNGNNSLSTNKIQTDPYVFVSNTTNTTNKALGVDNKTLANTPQTMASPATLDHHGYLKMLQEHITLYRTYAADGDVECKMLHKKKDEEYKKCESFDRSIGYVYAGSGRRTVEANKYASDPDTGRSKDKKEATQPTLVFPLDWALIRMDDTTKRDVRNRLPDVYSTKTKLVPTQQCRQWSTFNVHKEEVHVAKYGRTSGWTAGTVNTCMIIINPDADDDISGAYGIDAKNVAACFGVVSNDERNDFCEFGDHGSIVLHEGSGTQLGLLVGVTSTGQGMFLPMDVVFEDIKRVTGKDVVIPSFVGKLMFIPDKPRLR